MFYLHIIFFGSIHKNAKNKRDDWARYHPSSSLFFVFLFSLLYTMGL